MRNREKYVMRSLELHLFFARIMKEHSIFLKAGFTPCNADFAKRAEDFKNNFEHLLMCAVSLSDGIVGKSVLCSGEVFTEFTCCAESKTQEFTGICINQEITRAEQKLRGCDNPIIGGELTGKVNRLNRTAIKLLDGLIAFKQEVLNSVLCCRMFTANYPLLIEHIMREAKMYRTYLVCFESGTDCPCQTMRQIEQFWNRIMMEHAMFIRGQLDPCEDDLINTSDDFAKMYAELLEKSREASDRAMLLDETVKFRDFKSSGTKGILGCNIRSVILPLLADHVLREANHYIRLLKC